jgi:hypothetical protein
MWWMLARMAGWDGVITDVMKNKSPEIISVVVDNDSNEIRINTTDSFLHGQISIYDFNGFLLEKKRIETNNCTFNTSSLSSGVYFITVNNSNLKETKKIVVIN